MTALDASLTADEQRFLARIAALPVPGPGLRDARQKLSDAEVAMFRACCARGDRSVARVARDFGISHQHGYDLVHGKRRAGLREERT